MASIESNHELNISFNGQWFCTVELRADPLKSIREKTKIFKRKFPESERFKVTVRRIDCHINEMEVD